MGGKEGRQRWKTKMGGKEGRQRRKTKKSGKEGRHTIKRHGFKSAVCIIASMALLTSCTGGKKGRLHLTDHMRTASYKTQAGLHTVTMIMATS